MNWVVNLYVTGAGFVSGIGVGVVPGVVIGFRSVTDEYGCRLRKWLVSLGPCAVDTFRVCFFFFLLLCVIHGFASVINFFRGSSLPHLVVEYQLSVGVDGRYIWYLLACSLSDTDACCISRLPELTDVCY